MIAWSVLLSLLVILISGSDANSLAPDEYYEYYEDENHHYKFADPDHHIRIVQHVHPESEKVSRPSDSTSGGSPVAITTLEDPQHHQIHQNVIIGDENQVKTTQNPPESELTAEDANLAANAKENGEGSTEPNLYLSQTNEKLPTELNQETPIHHTPIQVDKDETEKIEENDNLSKAQILPKTENHLLEENVQEVHSEPATINNGPNGSIDTDNNNDQHIVVYNNTNVPLPYRPLNKHPFKPIVTQNKGQREQFLHKKRKVVHPFEKSAIAHLANILTKNEPYHSNSETNALPKSIKVDNSHPEVDNDSNSKRVDSLVSSNKGASDHKELDQANFHDISNDRHVNSNSDSFTGNEIPLNSQTGGNVNHSSLIASDHDMTKNAIKQVHKPHSQFNSLIPGNNEVKAHNTTALSSDKDPENTLILTSSKNLTSPADSSSTIQSSKNKDFVLVSDLNTSDGKGERIELSPKVLESNAQSELHVTTPFGSFYDEAVTSNDISHRESISGLPDQTESTKYISDNVKHDVSLPHTVESNIPESSVVVHNANSITNSGLGESSIGFENHPTSLTSADSSHQPYLERTTSNHSQNKAIVKPLMESNENHMSLSISSPTSPYTDITSGKKPQNSEHDIIIENKTNKKTNLDDYPTKNIIRSSSNISRPLNYTVKEEYFLLPMNASGLEILKKINHSFPQSLENIRPLVKLVKTKVVKKRKVKKQRKNNVDNHMKPNVSQEYATSNQVETRNKPSVLNEMSTPLVSSENKSQVIANEDTTANNEKEYLYQMSVTDNFNINNDSVTFTEQYLSSTEKTEETSTEESITPGSEIENSTELDELKYTETENPPLNQSLNESQPINDSLEETSEEGIYDTAKPTEPGEQVESIIVNGTVSEPIADEEVEPDTTVEPSITETFSEVDAPSVNIDLSPIEVVSEEYKCTVDGGCDVTSGLEEINDEPNTKNILDSSTEMYTLKTPRESDVDELLQIYPEDSINIPEVPLEPQPEIIDVVGNDEKQDYEEPETSIGKSSIAIIGSDNGAVEKVIERKTISKKIETVKITELAKRKGDHISKEYALRAQRKKGNKPHLFDMYEEYESV
uniref:DUF4758 domain-containing protein n=1 Tax=Graphocephala atropunctata TaxID=36148 RepID=A0A1B6K8M8_9HEMI